MNSKIARSNSLPRYTKWKHNSPPYTQPWTNWSEERNKRRIWYDETFWISL